MQIGFSFLRSFSLTFGAVLAPVGLLRVRRVLADDVRLELVPLHGVLAVRALHAVGLQLPLAALMRVHVLARREPLAALVAVERLVVGLPAVGGPVRGKKYGGRKELFLTFLGNNIQYIFIFSEAQQKRKCFLSISSTHSFFRQSNLFVGQSGHTCG